MSEKVYRYRPHIRWAQYFGLVVLAIGALFMLGSSVYGYLTYGDLSVFSLGVALLLGIEALVLFAFQHRVSTTRVRLGEDGIRYVNFRKDITIPYDEITGVGHPSIPYVGGWMSISSNDETIRLTVVLEDIGELIGELKERLDRRGLSHVYDDDKLFGFFKTASYSDQSWSRIYNTFLPVSAAVLTSGVLGGALGWMMTGGDCGHILVSATLGLGLAAGIYSIIEFFVFARKVSRQADPETFSVPDRDLDWERTIWKRTIAIGAALLCVAEFALLSLAQC